jgi:uncharacterized membrane protein YdcZ (DUF606 family)
MKKTLKTLLLTLVVMAATACSQSVGSGAKTKADALQVAAKYAMADYQSKTSRPVTNWALCPGATGVQVLVARANGFPERGRALIKNEGAKWEIIQGAVEDSYSTAICIPLTLSDMEKVAKGGGI